MIHECVQDFFIYVPPVDDGGTFSYLTCAEGQEIRSGGEYEKPGLLHESWMKISLDGSVIVYARLDEELAEL